jgi:hypothetical protein
MPTFRNTLFHLYGQVPAYEDGTDCSETSAYKIQTPGNYPEENIQLCCDKHAGMNPVTRVQVSDIINKLVLWFKSDYSWGAYIILWNWTFETRFDSPLVIKY